MVSRYLPLKPLRSRKNPDASLPAGCFLITFRETQQDFLPQIEFPRYYDTVDYMKIDEWTAREPGTSEVQPKDPLKHSLLGVMDETRSPMGARLLRRWMSYPLLCVEEIKKRQEAAWANCLKTSPQEKT